MAAAYEGSPFRPPFGSQIKNDLRVRRPDESILREQCQFENPCLRLRDPVHLRPARCGAFCHTCRRFVLSVAGEAKILSGSPGESE